MYYDIGAYDMLYSEFREMNREAWSEKIVYLCIDLKEMKLMVNDVYSMKAKTQKLNVFAKPRLFNFLDVVSN